MSAAPCREARSARTHLWLTPLCPTPPHLPTSPPPSLPLPLPQFTFLGLAEPACQGWCPTLIR